MPTFVHSLPSILGLLLLFIVPATAKIVYHTPPAKKHVITQKRTSKKARLTPKKNIQREQQDITLKLYLTFALLLLLPVLVLTGFGLVLFGFYSSWLVGFGIGLIILGTLGVILGGLLTGRTNSYSTNVLKTAVWVFFSIHLIGGLTTLLYGVGLLVGGVLFSALGIGSLVFALVFLIWALSIWQQNKAFRQGSRQVDKEEERG